MLCLQLFLTHNNRKEVDGIVYEVDCSMITVKEGDVDIGAHISLWLQA
jgi:Translationally controlled tumour protein